MKVSKTQRAFSLTLAMLMFSSSMSFSLDIHLCQGHIKSISLVGKAKSCYQEEESDQSKNLAHACNRVAGQDFSFSKKPCCVNAAMIFQSLEYQANLDLTIEDKPVLPIPRVMPTSRSLMQHNLSLCSVSDFRPHLPPWPHRDLIILYQVFLN